MRITMRQQALFINGVYKSVFEEILGTQAELPEQILFLQPHGPRPILDLRYSPPSVDDPMRLFASTTEDLGRMHYTAEIVGWDDKNVLSPARRDVITTIVNALQPREGGLYDMAAAPGGRSLNLIHVRRVQRVDAPFSVGRLLKVYGGGPLQDRTQAGGWAYCKWDRHAVSVRHRNQCDAHQGHLGRNPGPDRHA
jgi:hypothetical protein